LVLQRFRADGARLGLKKSGALASAAMLFLREFLRRLFHLRGGLALRGGHGADDDVVIGHHFIKSVVLFGK